MICRTCKTGGNLFYTKEFLPYHRDCVTIKLYNISEAFSFLEPDVQVKILNITKEKVEIPLGIVEAYRLLDAKEQYNLPIKDILLGIINREITYGYHPEKPKHKVTVQYSDPIGPKPYEPKTEPKIVYVDKPIEPKEPKIINNADIWIL